MKKIFNLFIILLLSVILLACDNIVPTEDEIRWDGLVDFNLEINEESPNYLENINVFVNNDTNITDLVTYNDEEVILSVEGKYSLYYNLTYKGKDYFKQVFVIVIDSNKEVIVTWEGLSNFNLIKDDDKPNYLSNVKAFVNDLEDITNQVFINDDNVNLSKVGTYDLYYIVKYNNQEYFEKVLVIVKSDPNSDEIELFKLNVFHINDLHGAVLEESNQIGLSKTANLILETNKLDGNEVVFIANGDILQGQLISNYFHGASIIDAFNYMNVDAMVVGNHEFDWGLDKVLSYFNNENEIQANFPLLGANIVDTRTNERPQGIDPYVILDKGGLKVGVIGLIGKLEGSISYEFVKDYLFTDAVASYKKYAKELRDSGVDMVIAAIHDSGSSFNYEVANLTGDLKVDLIFNAHTHQPYINPINNKVIMQSAANGTHIGHVTYDVTSDKNISLDQYNNLEKNDHLLLTQDNAEVLEVINEYYLIVEDLIKTELMTSGNTYGIGEMTEFMAKAMRIKLGVDIAYHNTGGTRTSLSHGEMITIETLYQMIPFDNQIITLELTGYDIKRLSNTSDIDPSLISTSDLDNNTYYKVATHSYIYGDGSNFRNARNVQITSYYIRDVLIEAFEQLSLTNTVFYTHLDFDFNTNKNKHIFNSLD